MREYLQTCVGVFPLSICTSTAVIFPLLLFQNWPELWVSLVTFTPHNSARRLSGTGKSLNWDAQRLFVPYMCPLSAITWLFQLVFSFTPKTQHRSVPSAPHHHGWWLMCVHRSLASCQLGVLACLKRTTCILWWKKVLSLLLKVTPHR